MECLLLYLCMVTVPYIMVRVERMSDYRGVRLARFHCNNKGVIGMLWEATSNDIHNCLCCSPLVNCIHRQG